MFKQASNRYQRSKGFKVKHAFQIALLVAVSVWLLYQVKHSHDKRRAYDEKQIVAHIESNAERIDGWNANGLGRKGKLEVFDEGSTSTNINAEKNEENEEEEEIKDPHTSSEENEHQDQGVGDDEIDRHAEERTEEQESLEENENITEKTENDEEGKAVDAEEEEHSGDVGAKFVQIIKQETDDTEETSETKDDHNENKEETSEVEDEKHDQEEHKIAKEQSENEHQESEEDRNAQIQSENEHREAEEDKKAEKQSENEHHEGEEDRNAENQSENEHREEEEIKNAEEKNENEHHEGEEVKDAEKKNENKHHEGEEVKVAEKKNENEHHEGEEVKDVEKKNENEHHKGEEDKNTENVENKSTESQLVPDIVLKENETVKASSPKGDDREEKSVDPVKMEESGAVNNETVAVDGIKDVAFVDSNAQKEAEKLEETKQEAKINSTVSYSDSNAETEHERLEENRKAVKESEAEDHEMEQSLTDNHENVAEIRKELDEFATSESKNETENTSQTNLEDVKLDASLDQGTAEDVAKSNDAEQNLVSDEASFKTDDASEETFSSERNATTESEHPDGGDAISQDIPGENEAGDRTDLETLPESETVGQNSEEISAQ
ncbi:uncharacterized protein LOC131063498 [Cryptomeria japonica]|uniref:uncharacterized protein LOC131063498 n=1 Tax=Cryptomeria japonica TaxID=3369 RepID=UPI0027DAA82E|nr:uncharacterized protein LOC131063498 [Cryptomeria japonica]